MTETICGYRGRDNVAKVRIVGLHNEIRDLPPRHDLANHSPDGFEWGYGGSGPAQLALAICAYALDDDYKAIRVYQIFKALFIATLPPDGWELQVGAVREIAESLECEDIG